MTDRRSLIFGAAACAAAIPTVASAACSTDADRFRDALERIALLDEADGHELTWETASMAVGIASQTLGKHPSEIFLDRERRRAARK